MSNSMNVVAHNLQGMFSNRQLGIVGDKKAKSTEKLISGYRINRAADDAAGLAISEKMRRQIRGLCQGTRNTQDGISMCQIADGALAEVSDILHRITELSVKSANGTNTSEDRQYIQKEVKNLINEVDKVSEATTFNEIPILKIGPLPEKIQGVSVAEKDLSNEQIINKLLNATFPDISGDIKIDDSTILSSTVANGILKSLSNYVIGDEIYKNGYSFPENKDEIEPLYMRAHHNIEYFVDFASDPEQGRFHIDQAKKLAEWGFSHDNKDSFGGAYTQYNYASYNSGVDCALSMEYLAHYLKLGGTNIDVFLRESAEDVRLELQYRGNIESGTLYDLCESMYPIGSYYSYYNKTDNAANVYRYLFGNEITEETDGRIWIQSGTEVGSGMLLEINRINSSVLGINSLDVSTREGAQNAMKRVEDALSTLMESRAKIGAQQNRLENTVRHQNNTIENTQAAESLIRDTDMAKEMLTLSSADIIQQAGQAMLSQTNQSNRGVLSLLQ